MVSVSSEPDIESDATPSDLLDQGTPDIESDATPSDFLDQGTHLSAKHSWLFVVGAMIVSLAIKEDVLY